MAIEKVYQLVENYIYLYHTDTFIVVPNYPDNFSDSMTVQYNNETPLSRSAPIYSYANSGPRQLHVSFVLHREMMQQINYGVSNVKLTLNDDYVDMLIKQIQAAVVPAYYAADKMVDPPLVAVRFGNEIFCKGIISGSVTTNYDGPILRNGKYAQVGIDFTMLEVDPYSAQQIAEAGSYRGLDMNLERRIFKQGGA